MTNTILIIIIMILNFTRKNYNNNYIKIFSILLCLIVIVRCIKKLTKFFRKRG
uniref:Uncharacterized protein n=1 Tax=Myoviridae sp. ctwwu11 TaxID=2823553 RepID=A0A8S5L6D4_9CAUD|nr:MAG TPA: hypothetical protein [Myoviridae sp. ctwwu11]DAO79218.1 MAG TPA: hypothetical protein [Caudoviricetes sp.]